MNQAKQAQSNNGRSDPIKRGNINRASVFFTPISPFLQYLHDFLVFRILSIDRSRVFLYDLEKGTIIKIILASPSYN